MDFLTLLLLAAGLSMDAFAVSVCKGMSMKETGLPQALVVGLWFGVFQALMPIIGYFLGIQFMGMISAWDHWIAFGLLTLIGVNMIREATEKDDKKAKNPEKNNELAFRTMLMAAVATSIDALALGFVYLSYTITNAMIVFSVIGIVTFLLSLLTIFLGKKIGGWLENWSGLIAGVVFIAIGLKILLESILSFSTSPAIDFQSISYIFTILK